MKIPLYSNLKAKLESKGLDSITSGQIAWFVCSVALAYIVFLLIILIDIKTIAWWVFIVVFLNHFFLFVFMWVVFILNFFYIKNLPPIGVNWLIACWYFFSANFYFSLFLCIIACVLFYALQRRLFYTFLFYLAYMVSTYEIFDLLGGFYK